MSVNTMNDDHIAAMNSITAIIAILGASDTLSISEQVAELKAQRDSLAAENAGLKAGIGFFSYDSSGCYEEHDTAEKAVACAEDSISEYRDNAPDGWSDEVVSVVWGVIMQRATMTGLRPVTEGDNVAPDIEEWCDYTLLPGIETPATDVFLAEVRAQGVEMFADSLGSPYVERGEECYQDGYTHAIERIKSHKGPEFAAQLRQVDAAKPCPHCGGIGTCLEHGCTATDQMLERHRAELLRKGVQS